MGAFGEAYWDADLSLPGRSNRRGGAYRYYIPDKLCDLRLQIDPELSHYLAQVERKVLALVRADGIAQLEDLARFLLRSEVISSSQIEGIAPAAKQIALAEIGEAEDTRGISQAAQLVARNMTVVSQAAGQLAHAERARVEDLVDLQGALLGSGPGVGIREVQNWIGVSNYHPIDADYVPPAPEQVPELLEDLLAYLNGAAHGPLVQAALVHSQFESIHPFVDGNGRVGRALIHAVLARRGLTSSQVLPVSLVFSTFRERYVASLGALRFDGSPEREENCALINQWVRLFAWAVEQASAQAERLRHEIEDLGQTWKAQLDQFRAEQGYQRELRSDSATFQILKRLAGSPVLTVKTASRIHHISRQKAFDALSQLRDAGILSARQIARGTTAYIADDVLDLVTLSERVLASTKFDTRVSPPVRGVPALPQH